jgi:hypothetical protein
VMRTANNLTVLYSNIRQSDGACAPQNRVQCTMFGTRWRTGKKASYDAGYALECVPIGTFARRIAPYNNYLVITFSGGTA